jgi:hypothetical protein
MLPYSRCSRLVTCGLRLNDLNEVAGRKEWRREVENACRFVPYIEDRERADAFFLYGRLIGHKNQQPKD